jgi:hypothetical protein
MTSPACGRLQYSSRGTKCEATPVASLNACSSRFPKLTSGSREWRETSASFAAAFQHLSAVRERRVRRSSRFGTVVSDRSGVNEAEVQFVLGVFLFVVVVGLIDLYVPWPKTRNFGGRS